MNIRFVLSLLILSTFSLVSCTNQDDNHKTSDNQRVESEEVATSITITIPLQDSKGKQMAMANLTQKQDGVHINVTSSSLPTGEHGFHFHEIGKCEGPDFTSAGDHFNPMNQQHGHQDDPQSHAGDLPNIRSNEEKMTNETIIAKHVSLLPGKKNTLLDEDGSALIIHEQPDDYTTQPSGNAGARMACGSISS